MNTKVKIYLLPSCVACQGLPLSSVLKYQLFQWPLVSTIKEIFCWKFPFDFSLIPNILSESKATYYEKPICWRGEEDGKPWFLFFLKMYLSLHSIIKYYCYHYFFILIVMIIMITVLFIINSSDLRGRCWWQFLWWRVFFVFGPSYYQGFPWEFSLSKRHFLFTIFVGLKTLMAGRNIFSIVYVNRTHTHFSFLGTQFLYRNST